MNSQRFALNTVCASMRARRRPAKGSTGGGEGQTGGGVLPSRHFSPRREPDRAQTSATRHCPRRRPRDGPRRDRRARPVGPPPPHAPLRPRHRRIVRSRGVPRRAQPSRGAGASGRGSAPMTAETTWRLPPVWVLLVAVVLIVCAEVGGASVSRFKIEITRWARGTMLTHPAVHGL